MLPEVQQFVILVLPIQSAKMPLPAALSSSGSIQSSAFSTPRSSVPPPYTLPSSAFRAFMICRMQKCHYRNRTHADTNRRLHGSCPSNVPQGLPSAWVPPQAIPVEVHSYPFKSRSLSTSKFLPTDLSVSVIDQLRQTSQLFGSGEMVFSIRLMVGVPACICRTVPCVCTIICPQTLPLAAA